jgi:hypothetical protein
MDVEELNGLSILCSKVKHYLMFQQVVNVEEFLHFFTFCFVKIFENKCKQRKKKTKKLKVRNS